MSKPSGRLRRLTLASAAMVMTWGGSSACAGPFQYYGGTGLHDATRAEVAGTWVNVENTRVDLRQDGTALIRQLDGQDFDFDEGWRLSGAGSRELTDDDSGQEVSLTLTKRTGTGTRLAAATGTEPLDVSTGPGSPPAPPVTYTWHFYVDRDDHDELALFFFYGDPDIGNAYVMSRAAPAPSRGKLSSRGTNPAS